MSAPFTLPDPSSDREALIARHAEDARCAASSAVARKADRARFNSTADLVYLAMNAMTSQPFLVRMK